MVPTALKPKVTVSRARSSRNDGMLYPRIQRDLSFVECKQEIDAKISAIGSDFVLRLHRDSWWKYLTALYTEGLFDRTIVRWPVLRSVSWSRACVSSCHHLLANMSQLSYSQNLARFFPNHLT